MNWDAIGATGEWAGAIAVVATLGYPAVQIRQNASSMRSSTGSVQSSLAKEWWDRKRAFFVGVQGS